MELDKEKAQFGRARWRKIVLLPCWVICIPILLGLMGVFAYRLPHSVPEWKNVMAHGGLPVELVWESVNLGFSLISVVIIFTQVAKFIAEALTPFALLFGNVVSLVLSGGILALDIVMMLQHTEKEYSIIALALDCALLVLTIIPTVYGVRVYRRVTAYDDYYHPQTMKNDSSSNGIDEEAWDTSYDPVRYSVNITSPAAPTPHDLTNTTNTSQPYSPSGDNSRYQAKDQSQDALNTPGPRASTDSTGPRALYDHKRNTQFDEYVAKRHSGTLSKEAVDQAIRAEFGWGKNGYGAGNRVIRSGTVASSRPMSDSFKRVSSWEVSLGGQNDNYNSARKIEVQTISPPSSSSSVSSSMTRVRGLSLGSVPETPEEHEADGMLTRTSEAGDSTYLTVGVGRRGSNRKRLAEAWEEIQLERAKDNQIKRQRASMPAY